MQRRMHCRRRKAYATDFARSAIFEQKDGPRKRRSESNKIPPRAAFPPARLVAVNHFETTSSDTLIPYYCYFCRSLHNGTGPQEPIEHG
jgi:hypothetical protein